ncbi:MAG: hypothetical protein JNK63_03445 [Chthonomonas sp.]|nr:hypothetical protein [Chthonomonas sp.]
MTSFELSRLADSILRSIPRDPQRPHYTEDSFRCKLSAAHQRDAKLLLPPPPASQLYLLKKEWAYLFRRAKLTHRQKEIIGYRMAGKTFEEIGEIRGTSKQAVLNILHQACRKIARVRASYAYEGLAEVYHEETNRGRRTDYKGKLVR